MTEVSGIPVYRTIAEVREAVGAARTAGRRVGVVPTMGAMHEGHLSLIRAAAQETDYVVVTVFVNPTQFGPDDDLERYPRQLQQDCRLVREAGADAVFAPTNEEMYPPGYETYVEITRLSAEWEGRHRPGHFRGVATIVLKLFNIVGADAAYFGQKDGQQARVVAKMAEDLNVPAVVRVMPTVREADGLAMSSRNAYLSPTERREAAKLSQALKLAEELVAGGERDSEAIVGRMRAIVETIPEAEIDYIGIMDAESLEAVERIESTVMVALAVQVGPARLIDNALIAP